MICKHCKNEIPDISKFCPVCGNVAEAEPVQEVTQQLGQVVDTPSSQEMTQQLSSVNSLPDVLACSKCGGDILNGVCSSCGYNYSTNVTEKKPKEKKKLSISKIATAVLSVLLVVSIVVFSVSYTKLNGKYESLWDDYSDERTENSSLSLQVDELEDEVAELEEDIKAYDYLIEDGADVLLKYAVFVQDIDDTYYHKWSCSNFDNEESFFIFNVNYAEYLEFSACPYCCE